MDELSKFFKDKRTQQALLVVLVLLVIYVTFKPELDAFFKKLFKKRVPSIDEADRIDMQKILKKGSDGVEVRTLQNALVTDGGQLPRYGTDGIFGTETENALISIKGVKEISLLQYQSGNNIGGGRTNFDFTARLGLYDASGIAGGLDTALLN